MKYFSVILEELKKAEISATLKKTDDYHRFKGVIELESDHCFFIVDIDIKQAIEHEKATMLDPPAEIIHDHEIEINSITVLWGDTPYAIGQEHLDKLSEYIINNIELNYE